MTRTPSWPICSEFRFLFLIFFLIIFNCKMSESPAALQTIPYMDRVDVEKKEGEQTSDFKQVAVSSPFADKRR
jgi:hypothetical protein